MPRYTAQEAFEARDAGESIMLDCEGVKRLCEAHGGTPQSDTYFERFYNENPFIGAHSLIDAAAVLEWLGY
jgi:hypothetical protein